MRNRPQDQDMFNRFVEWGNQRESVRALILTSSLTNDKAPVDALSDYDLIVITTDIRPFFEDRAWLGDFGPVLVLYHDPIILDDGLERTGFVTQYEDGLKIDFSLWPVEMLQRLVDAPELSEEFDAGYHIVLDKDHLTDTLKPPTYKGYIPTPPTEAEFYEAVEWIFQEATYAAKFLWRDDMIAARHILDNMMKQDFLVPMLIWHYEIDHNWTVKPGPYGRRLKMWLRPDLWAELEKTYTGLDVDTNWDALFRTIALFRKVALEVGNHLGYSYPQDLHDRALAYLYKVKNLDPQAERFP